MAVHERRHVAWLMLLAPSLIGARFALERAQTEGRRLVYGGATLALAAAVALSPFMHGHARLFGIDRDHAPVAACDFIDEHGLVYRPFNSYEWGGYMIYRLWPWLHVFADGRTDLYGDRILGEYLKVARGAKGWRDVLKHYDVQMLLIDYRRNAAAQFFEDRRVALRLLGRLRAGGAAGGLLQPTAAGRDGGPLLEPGRLREVAEGGGAEDDPERGGRRPAPRSRTAGRPSPSAPAAWCGRPPRNPAAATSC